MKGNPKGVWSKGKIPTYVFRLLVIILLIIFGIKISVNGLHDKNAQYGTKSYIGDPMKIIHNPYQSGNHADGVQSAFYPWALKLFCNGIGVAECQHGMARRK